MKCFGLHSFIPDTVSSSEDPLLRDQSASTGVSPLALSVVLQGNLKRTHEHNKPSLSLNVLSSQRLTAHSQRCLYHFLSSPCFVLFMDVVFPLLDFFENLLHCNHTITVFLLQYLPSIFILFILIV